LHRPAADRVGNGLGLVLARPVADDDRRAGFAQLDRDRATDSP
jgi:hypothetical protein